MTETMYVIARKGTHDFLYSIKDFKFGKLCDDTIKFSSIETAKIFLVAIDEKPDCEVQLCQITTSMILLDQ